MVCCRSILFVALFLVAIPIHAEDILPDPLLRSVNTYRAAQLKNKFSNTETVSSPRAPLFFEISGGTGDITFEWRYIGESNWTRTGKAAEKTPEGLYVFRFNDDPEVTLAREGAEIRARVGNFYTPIVTARFDPLLVHSFPLNQLGPVPSRILDRTLTYAVSSVGAFQFKSPIIATLQGEANKNPNAPADRFTTLRLTDLEGQSIYSERIPKFGAGYEPAMNAPVITDLDGDGINELIIVVRPTAENRCTKTTTPWVCDRELYIIPGNSKPVVKTNFKMPWVQEPRYGELITNYIHNVTAVDLRGDSRKQIAVQSEGSTVLFEYYPNESAVELMFRDDTGTAPIFTNRYQEPRKRVHLVVAKNRSGAAERLFYTTYDRSTEVVENLVPIRQGDASLREIVPSGAGYSSQVRLKVVGSLSDGSLAAGDLDGDGEDDIVLASSEEVGPRTYLGYLRVLRLDGSTITKRQYFAQFGFEPILGDLNRNGRNELVFSEGIPSLTSVPNYKLRVQELRKFELPDKDPIYELDEVAGFPYFFEAEYEATPLVVAQFDEDLELEVVVSTRINDKNRKDSDNGGLEGSLVVLNHDGTRCSKSSFDGRAIDTFNMNIIPNGVTSFVHADINLKWFVSPFGVTNEGLWRYNGTALGLYKLDREQPRKLEGLWLSANADARGTSRVATMAAVVIGTPTATPTVFPTKTATPRVTPTSTPTQYPTKTATTVPTVIATVMPTFTATPIPTTVRTVTPTATSTPIIVEKTLCTNGADDDLDGDVDNEDSGCADSQSDSERGNSICDNGRDDDRDGLTDFPDDPGCLEPSSSTEYDRDSFLCDNGLDDDRDGLKDMLDSGCWGVSDDSEEVDKLGEPIDLFDQVAALQNRVAVAVQAVQLIEDEFMVRIMSDAFEKQLDKVSAILSKLDVRLTEFDGTLEALPSGRLCFPRGSKFLRDRAGLIRDFTQARSRYLNFGKSYERSSAAPERRYVARLVAHSSLSLLQGRTVARNLPRPRVCPGI